MLVTGYLGSPGNAAVIADFVERALTRNSKLVYLCDPVIGDDGRVYVADGILDVVQHRLLPAANLTTPNQFELELLSGVTIADTHGLRTAARRWRGNVASMSLRPAARSLTRQKGRWRRSCAPTASCRALRRRGCRSVPQAPAISLPA